MPFVKVSVQRNSRYRTKVFGHYTLAALGDYPARRISDLVAGFNHKYQGKLSRATAVAVLERLRCAGKIEKVGFGCFALPGVPGGSFEAVLARSEPARKVFDRMVRARGLKVRRDQLVLSTGLDKSFAYVICKRFERVGLIHSPKRGYVAFTEAGERFAGLLPAHTPAHTSAPAEIDIFS